MNTLLGRKKEMTQVYDTDGNAIPVTIVDISDIVIADQLKSTGKITHLVLGKDTKKNPNKPTEGKYKKLGRVPNFTFVYKVASDADVQEVGAELDLSTIKEGDIVSVSGTNKGKGFQGVVKRWNFAGGPGTHGASDRERHPGSIGSRMTPGRVFKGMKMGGHMGAREVSIKNLKVIKVDLEKKLILISGSLPGAKNSYLVITKSK